MKYNPTTESDFLAAAAFNHKTPAQLNGNLRALVKAAFPNCKDDDVIQCGICNRFSKPDIYLQIDGIRRYISLKSGGSESVHTEHVKNVILFLRSIGISAATQKTLLRYHYGDGTLTGTGEVRHLASELYPMMKEEIARANKELNQFRIIEASLDRFVFQGNPIHPYAAEFIAFGDPTYFVFASKEDIVKGVLNDKYDHINYPHIGPLMIQPFLRDPERKSPHPEKRDIAHFRWPNLLGSVQKIAYRKQRAERMRKIAQYQKVKEGNSKNSAILH